jgi:hypothetical protein
MNRSIVPVVKKVKPNQAGNDFAYWQSHPYEARIAALEEIRREYHQWIADQQEDDPNAQPGFHRVYRIVKR